MISLMHHAGDDLVDGVLALPDGRRVGYRVRGPRAGRQVVYFHGQPGCRLEADLIPDRLLGGFGLRVLSFDRPGMGRSDLIQAEDMMIGVEDAIHLADHVGIDRFAVIGVSAGGPPALAISAGHPERVDRTILVSASGEYDDDRYMHPADVAHFKQLREQGPEPLVPEYEAFRKSLLADVEGTIARLFAAFPEAERTWISSPPAKAPAAADFLESLAQGSAGHLRETEVRALPWSFNVASIRTPVRAFHGDADSLERLSNIQRIIDAVPDGALTVYPGGDHLSPWLHPEDFLRAVVA